MGIGMMLRHLETPSGARCRKWRKNISKDGTCATAPLGIGLVAYYRNGAQVAQPHIPAFEVAQIFCERNLLRIEFTQERVDRVRGAQCA